MDRFIAATELIADEDSEDLKSSMDRFIDFINLIEFYSDF